MSKVILSWLRVSETEEVVIAQTLRLDITNIRHRLISTSPNEALATNWYNPRIIWIQCRSLMTSRCLIADQQRKILSSQIKKAKPRRLLRELITQPMDYTYKCLDSSNSTLSVRLAVVVARLREGHHRVASQSARRSTLTVKAWIMVQPTLPVISAL